MEIQYISSVMHPEDFAELFKDTTTMPGQQAQKYHRLMIEGIAANGVPVHVISSAPVTRRNYSKVFYKGGKRVDHNIRYSYLPVIMLPSVKTFMQMMGAFFRILFLKDRTNQAVVCDVLNASVACGAIAAAKIRRIPCVGVVTDLPNMMVTGGSSRYVKIANKNIRGCTHYVVLTEQMNEVVNPEGKPYVVIEGLCDVHMKQLQQGAEEKIPGRCMYAGLLDARYGVKKMVEAFVEANVPGTSLHIYGNGPYAQELSEYSKEHTMIQYHGSVLNEEVVQAERQCSLLINPRPTTEEFTKYSFPSKNMEYMASGTATLTTDLPGMPEEYKEYVFLFEDESIGGMSMTFQNVLSLDNTEINMMGILAKEFVLMNKNNEIQSNKILLLLNNRL